MVELKVLEHICKQLTGFTTNPFALWNEADPVYQHLIGVDSYGKQAYLKNERRQFFDALLSTPSYEINIAIDTILSRLAFFWQDSKEYLAANKDGIGTDPRGWTLIKAYYNETAAYASELYYYILIRPDLTKIDVCASLPGFERKWVKDYLTKNGFLTAEKFTQLDIFGKQSKDKPEDHKTNGKTYEAKERFSSDDAAKIYSKLWQMKWVDANADHYRWKLKDNESLSYLCYKMSVYLLGEEAQIESAMFCQKIQSDTDPKTVGRYARAYKNGTKQITEKKRQEIDNLFK